MCAFDFDGTLAPIVVHPESARLRVRTRHLLERAAALYPCVVVSGRARADVLAKLGDLKLSRVIGNHGAETGVSRTPHKKTREWKAVLTPSLAARSGVWIEDKGLPLRFTTGNRRVKPRHGNASWRRRRGYRALACWAASWL